VENPGVGDDVLRPQERADAEPGSIRGGIERGAFISDDRPSVRYQHNAAHTSAALPARTDHPHRQAASESWSVFFHYSSFSLSLHLLLMSEINQLQQYQPILKHVPELPAENRWISSKKSRVCLIALWKIFSNVTPIVRKENGGGGGGGRVFLLFSVC